MVGAGNLHAILESEGAERPSPDFDMIMPVRLAKRGGATELTVANSILVGHSVP